MTAPVKAAVRKVDFERFRLDGGSLVIYPPRKGSEMAGMVNVWISDAPPPSVTVLPIPLAPRGPRSVRKLEKAHG